MFDTDRAVLLRSNDMGLLSVAFSIGYSADELSGVRLSHRDRLSKWLQTNETSLVVETDKEVVDYLSQEERDMLARLGVRLCLPLLALNRLTGVMLLSSSNKKWRLSQDDLNLLQMLVGQASIAFETAYLYQQQNDRLRRFYRAERLATAGQLAASVAHEIRNPLTSIRSTVQYLLGQFNSSNPKRSLIEGVIQEVDRIDRTLEGLLSLTRGTEFKPEKIALGQLLKQALLLVRAQSNNQAVEIKLISPELELYVMGDVLQFKQLFLNLMLNSLQAMETGGKLEVKLDGHSDASSLKDIMWASVYIKDTGCGIPAEMMDKVFDPFFTTKQKGTGLGLSTSFSIVQQHGGELEIDSEVDVGTTVAVRLPLVN